MSARQRKILMVNLPFSGHTNPTLELARVLVGLGHQVAYVHAPEWRGKVEQTGAHFIPYDNYPDNLSASRKELRSFSAAYDTVFCIGKDFDCLIYEMLFVSGKALADRLGIPSFRLFSTFALNEQVISDFAQTGGWQLTAFFRYKPLLNFLSRRLQKRFGWYYPDIVNEITRNNPALNFTYTVREFQPYADDFDADKYQFVGPSIGDRGEATFDFSEMSDPIIYVSLGTLLNTSVKFFKTCIEAFKHQPVSVIMSIGKTIKVEQLGALPDNVFVYPYVPQLEILQKASLFITHGGMNSVNESLYYGCPMLVIPMGNDQPRVAQQVVDLHLGKMVAHKGLTAKQLRDSAYSVLQDVSYQKKLEEFQNLSQSAGGNQAIAQMILKSLDNQPK